MADAITEPAISRPTLAKIVEELVLTDAMTGDSDGTPSGYYVHADNLEYLVETVLSLAADELNRDGVGFKAGSWSSNQRDQDRLWGIGACVAWLRGQPVAAPDAETVDADQQPAAADQRYRVLPSPYYKPSSFALAPRYSELADALAAMGEGIVVADDGHIAAFHERHLGVLEARDRAEAGSVPRG